MVTAMNQTVKYEVPSSIKETVELLRTYGDKARIISGGTMLFELINRNLLADVERLLDISQTGLDYATHDANSLTIGAMTTMSSLLDYVLINSMSGVEALVDCLKEIHPVQVRNVATIGGAVASAIPFLDLPPALMCLDARLSITDDQHERRLGLNNFYKGPYQTDLKAEELIREVTIDLSPNLRMASAFRKSALTAVDYALVNCGVMLKADAEGSFKELRVIMGGIATEPMRLDSLETDLLSINLNDVKGDAILNNITKSIENVEFNPNLRASEEYLRRIAPIVIRDALLGAISRVK
jgi:CO/xanthine dehydrogenase FAD-binding subunit